MSSAFTGFMYNIWQGFALQCFSLSMHLLLSYMYILECSVISNLGDNLTVEVYRIQLLFSRKLLGLATIPLHSIRHSNRVL